ncbi:hypothetical protein AAMO2058_001416700 [Amorphochlora amoebiformis]
MSGRRRLRVIAHLDLDCFYVQVECRRKPELKGKPTCVVQYNAWKGGAMIAVSYEARSFGITRSMRGEEAKKKCPEVNLVTVPVSNGKSDLQIYRRAGAEVIRVIEPLVDRVERASIDEAYVDITSQSTSRVASSSDSQLLEGLQASHIVGVIHNPRQNSAKLMNHTQLKSEGAATDLSKKDVRLIDLIVDEEDRLLAAGALIIKEMREKVLKVTKFTLSAGVGFNRMVAKLVSGMNKPRAQTLIHRRNTLGFFNELPVRKIKGLGKKFGEDVCSALGIKTMGELAKFSTTALVAKFGPKNGTWLSRVAQGLDDTEVKGRCLANSIGCSKTFLGKNITVLAESQHWIQELANEISARVKEDNRLNSRLPRTLTVGVSFQKSKREVMRISQSNLNPTDKWNGKLNRRRSKSCAFVLASIRVDAKKTLTKLLAEARRENGYFRPIVALGLVAGNMVNLGSKQSSLLKAFLSKDSSKRGGAKDRTRGKDKENKRTSKHTPLDKFLLTKPRQSKNQPHGTQDHGTQEIETQDHGTQDHLTKEIGTQEIETQDHGTRVHVALDNRTHGFGTQGDQSEENGTQGFGTQENRIRRLGTQNQAKRARPGSIEVFFASGNGSNSGSKGNSNDSSNDSNDSSNGRNGSSNGPDDSGNGSNGGNIGKQSHIICGKLSHNPNSKTEFLPITRNIVRKRAHKRKAVTSVGSVDSGREEGRSRLGLSKVDPHVLAQLPPSIRQEILRHVNHEGKRINNSYSISD